MRLTKKRQQILDVMKSSNEALTAKELHAALPEVDQVTIYRALDVFVAEGLVTKLNLVAGEASYEYQHEPHHHAVCTDCDRVIHFSIKDEDLRKLLPLKDFDIAEVELTVRGHCGER